MKLFIIMILFISSLFASSNIRYYEGGVTFYGTTGSGSVTKTDNSDNTYTIHLRSKPTEFIGKLSGVLGAEFISEGVVLKNGVYQPLTFTSIKDAVDKYEKTTYTFYHDDHNKTIIKAKYIKKYVHQSHFDVHTFKIVKSHTIEEEISENNISYSTDDYLSLVQNVKFLKSGIINYVDKSDDDTLNLVKNDSEHYDIRVDKKDESYLVRLINDDTGLVDAQTIKATFFGDAWIRSVSQPLE